LYVGDKVNMTNAEGHRCEVCNEQASYLKSFIGRMVCKNCFDLIRSEDENFLNLSLKE
jgi:formylmethanofuran dehydrogenase subunit E